MQIILYQIVFCLHYLYKWDPLATDIGSACFYFQSFVAVPFKSCITFCYYRIYVKKLQSMQYRILRIVFVGANYSRNIMLEKAGVENLEKKKETSHDGLDV